MVTLQSPSKHGAALIKYILDNKAHDGSEQRNICVETLNLMPSASSSEYIKQFKREWSHMSSRHTTQCRHLIFSPSDQEIAYTPDNAQAFADLVKKYIEAEFPNRRAIIAVQMDGSGYKDSNENVKKVLHAHVVLSDADLFEYKAIKKDKQTWFFLKTSFNKHFTKVTGKEIDTGRNYKKRRHLHNKLVTENQRDNEGKFISYIDDIKDRINRCILSSNSPSEYWENLKNFGLSVVHHERKKSGDTYQTYELHDLSNISDSSKDKDGNIKKLVRNKGQHPSLRSYKHEGLSIEDIQRKIQEHITELDAQEEVEEELIDATADVQDEVIEDEVVEEHIQYDEDVYDEYEDDNDNNYDRQKEFTYKRYQKARAELNMDSIEREAMKQRQRQKQKSL